MTGRVCNLNVGMGYVRHQGSCALSAQAEKVLEQATRPTVSTNGGLSSNWRYFRLDGANPHGCVLRPTVQPRTPQRACTRTLRVYVRDGFLRHLVNLKSRLGRLGG